MTDYDFSSLNDKEFEVLCTDILTETHGQRFVRFKPGKDAGVDGRYFTYSGREVVLQCKHWQATPLEQLVSHLKKFELPKIERLSPSRYILAVSHQLSRADKARIASILSPFVKSDDDIVGREDLNDLLARHPAIERRHYKLWIRSTTVLDHLFNKAIHDRSEYTLREILQGAKLYVRTKAHEAAVAILDEHGTVIVTGAPGIGKSTLAEQLVLQYASAGYQFLQISDDIREAESAYNLCEKQIFYFDDFLGRNYLQALKGHEGSQIVRFIRRVSGDKSKRFVLTSRSTILNQGKSLIDVFEHNNIAKSELEIRIDSLQNLDKARILYNHIWYSGLNSEFVDQLYIDKRYRQIISHKNFNPRLIQFITDAQSISDRSASDYWPHTQQLLENPAKVWQHPFEAQLDDFGRAMVLLVALNHQSIAESDLAEAYSRYISRPECRCMAGRRDFLLTLQHLVGSLLTRTTVALQSTSPPRLALFNPSIGDFILHRYATDIPTLRAGFVSLRSASSTQSLHGLVSNDLLEKQQAESLALEILSCACQFNFVGYDANHIGALLNFIEHSTCQEFASIQKQAIHFILSSDPPTQFYESGSAIEQALEQRNCDHNLVEPWAVAACSKWPYSHEIALISRITAYIEPEASARVNLKLDDAKLDFLAENASEEIDACTVFRNATPDDFGPAWIALDEIVARKLEELGLEPTPDRIETVVDAFDLDAQATSFFYDVEPDPDWEDFSKDVSSDEIDDLFDRSR